MPPAGGDAGLVEEPAQDHRAPRREVVAVVVEERVHLVGLRREAAELLDPFGELLRRVHPVEPLGRLLGLDVPRLLVPAVEAHVRDRMRRGRVAGDHVRRARHRGVDGHVREAVALEERERVGALVRLHPGSVPELDERDEGCDSRADPLELGERFGRLHEARVVLEQDPAQLPGQLQRLDRRPEGGKRRVVRLALVARHRLVRLHVEGELGRCPLRPVPRDPGIGEVVVGRVDLDRVEALGVVPQPCLRCRDAARIPRLDEASSAKEQVPRRTVAGMAESVRGDRAAPRTRSGLPLATTLLLTENPLRSG